MANLNVAGVAGEAFVANALPCTTFLFANAMPMAIAVLVAHCFLACVPAVSSVAPAATVLHAGSMVGTVLWALDNVAVHARVARVAHALPVHAFPMLFTVGSAELPFAERPGKATITQAMSAEAGSMV